MAETTHLDSLKINVLTKEQFAGAIKDPNQIYMISDEAEAQEKITGQPGQFVGFDESGNAIAQTLPEVTPDTLVTGTANGSVKFNGKDVAVQGLKSAAYTESTAYDVAGAASGVETKLQGQIANKADKTNATQTTAGLMSAADKLKLDGVATKAEVNVQSDWNDENPLSKSHILNQPFGDISITTIEKTFSANDELAGGQFGFITGDEISYPEMSGSTLTFNGITFTNIRTSSFTGGWSLSGDITSGGVTIAQHDIIYLFKDNDSVSFYDPWITFPKKGLWARAKDANSNYNTYKFEKSPYIYQNVKQMDRKYVKNIAGKTASAEGSELHNDLTYSYVSGKYSLTEGFCTYAESDYQHVQGKYNLEDTANKYAHIIGNGTGQGVWRSNAHTVDWKGNAWYQGNVYIGGAGQDDAEAKKLATEAYVDSRAGLKARSLTSAEYDALPTKDDNTLYMLTDGYDTINLPPYTSADEGKVLKIVNGTPAWVKP